MMVSPFFAGRGKVYFYNLMEGASENQSLACGDYFIVQRHPYGEAPSASSKCKCFPDSCLVCPAHPSPNGKTASSSTKSYAPSDARMIQILGHYTDRSQRNWEMKGGNIQFNGIRKIIKYCAPFETDSHIQEDMRLLAHLDFSEEPATDISNNYTLRNRNLSNGGVDDEFISFLVEDRIRVVGCTASFGFVKDEDMTYQMKRADSSSSFRGEEFGFEFIQLELCIGLNDPSSPASEGSEQTQPEYTEYRREVIIGIKIHGEAGNERQRVASGHTLRQPLCQTATSYAREEEQETVLGTIVAEKYEIAPAVPAFVAPVAPMGTSSVYFKKRDETPLPPHIANALHAGSQYEKSDEVSRENGIGYDHGHGLPSIHVQPPTPVESNTPTEPTISSSNSFVQPYHEDVGLYVNQKTFEPPQYEQWLAGVEYNDRGEWAQHLLNWVTRCINELEGNVMRRQPGVDTEILVALRDARNYMIDRVEGIRDDRENRMEAGEKLAEEERMRMMKMFGQGTSNPYHTTTVSGKTVDEEEPVNEWIEFWSEEKKWDYKKGVKETGYWGSGNKDDPMGAVVKRGMGR